MDEIDLLHNSAHIVNTTILYTWKKEGKFYVTWFLTTIFKNLTSKKKNAIIFLLSKETIKTGHTDHSLIPWLLDFKVSDTPLKTRLELKKEKSAQW